MRDESLHDSSSDVDPGRASSLLGWSSGVILAFPVIDMKYNWCVAYIVSFGDDRSSSSILIMNLACVASSSRRWYGVSCHIEMPYF